MNTNTRQDLGKLILRVTLGVLVLLHGIAKLKGGVDGVVGMVGAQGLPGLLGYAVLVGEVLAPLLLPAGFHARIGALRVAANMVVAIVLAHMGQLGALDEQGGWALELQGMFLGGALAIMLLGPGRFGINNR